MTAVKTNNRGVGGNNKARKARKRKESFIANSSDDDQPPSTPREKKKAYQKKRQQDNSTRSFRQAWLSDERTKGWLGCKPDGKAYCMCCHEVFTTNTWTAFIRHAESSKHGAAYKKEHDKQQRKVDATFRAMLSEQEKVGTVQHDCSAVLSKSCATIRPC